MNWSKGIRQVHRWLSMAFTVGFIVNLVFVIQGVEPAPWVYFLALVPLFILFATGLYLFAQPYAAKWRVGRSRNAV